MLQLIQEAITEAQLTQALKCWLILPQLLLMQAKRNGMKGQGARIVDGRFHAVVEGDWGMLLTMWELDRLPTRGWRRHRGGGGGGRLGRRRRT